MAKHVAAGIGSTYFSVHLARLREEREDRVMVLSNL